MGKLVADGGGEIAGWAVHIHIGLARKGEVKAREVHGAEKTGHNEPLGSQHILLKTGEQLHHTLVALLGTVENLTSRHGEHALHITLHLVGILNNTLGEIGSNRRQLLHRAAAGSDTRFLLEAVRTVKCAPQQAGAG